MWSLFPLMLLFLLPPPPLPPFVMCTDGNATEPHNYLPPPTTLGCPLRNDYRHACTATLATVGVLAAVCYQPSCPEFISCFPYFFFFCFGHLGLNFFLRSLFSVALVQY